MDNSTLLDASKPLEHVIDLLCFRGRPVNLDSDRPISIIVNHGYVVGFSPDRLQPLWAAYRVAAAERDVNYKRPHLFYDDKRLPEDWRVGVWGFGSVGGNRYDRGHLVPNFAINTQFGRLAQMETFFMSNISPQRSKMNRGVWQRLEKAIVRDWAPAWEHIWVITGPIFGENPEVIRRPDGKEIDIPESFYAILVDPIRWPHDDPKNVFFLALQVSQDLEYVDPGDDLITTVGAIEQATSLRFFSDLDDEGKEMVAQRTASEMWRIRDLERE